MSLAIESNDISSGWDRTFLNISSEMAEIFCRTSEKVFRVLSTLDPNEFDNLPSRTQEVAFRALIVFTGFLLVCALPLTLAIGLTFGLGSKIFKAVGYALQKDGFTHIRGSAPEEPMGPESTYLTLNGCLVAGGLSRNHGGPVDWRIRIDALIQQILEADAGTIMLQEVYDTAACERLVKGLGAKYAHFFTHLGPSVWGSEGGCMVITKHAYSHFSHTKFSNSDWTLGRGYAILELKAAPDAVEPSFRVVATHLIDGESEIDGKEAPGQVNRAIQVAEIVNGIAERTLKVAKPIPTYVGGDLNINRGSAEDQKRLIPFLEHSYKGHEPTCTYTLLRKWDPVKYKDTPEEILDYFSKVTPDNEIGLKVADSEVVSCRRISTYTPGNTKTARSDHDGLLITVAASA